MTRHLQAALWFSAGAFLASLPLAYWMFSDKAVPGNSFGSLQWLAVPLVAVLSSGIAAYIIMGFSSEPRFGAARGALAALIALVVSAGISHPSLVLPALLVLTWIVVPLGALVGWFVQHGLIERPNPAVNSDAPSARRLP
jgi:hypothetical protein